MIVVEMVCELKMDSSNVFRMRDETGTNQELFRRDINKGSLNLYISVKASNVLNYSFIFIIIKLEKFINDSIGSIIIQEV